MDLTRVDVSAPFHLHKGDQSLSFVCVRLTNLGRRGRIRASARILKFERASYPQRLLTYPLPFRYGRLDQTMDEGAHDDLLLAEYSQPAIQDNRLTCSLLTYDGPGHVASMLSDITAIWTIALIVRRATLFNLAFTRQAIVEIHADNPNACEEVSL